MFTFGLSYLFVSHYFREWQTLKTLMSSEAIWSGSPLFAYAILSEQLVYQVSGQLWYANSSGSDEAAHLIIMISLLYSSTYFTASNETAEATNEQLTVLADLDSH